jgi:hypothetical protein
MEVSILASTRNSLGVGDDTAFDDELIMHINSAFSTLAQLGIGGATGFSIDSDTQIWDGAGGLGLPPMMLSMVRSYIFHKTKLLFDTPTTSFALDALKAEVREEEFRLQAFAEEEASVIP